MNTLYYSNYCKHCQKVIQFFTKNNLTDKANFICIDNRKRDPATGAIVIIMPNGSAINLPPNLQSVPAMLVPSRNYQMVMGDDILQLYSSVTASIGGGGGGANTAASIHAHVEPSAFSFSAASGGGVFSEQYTSVALSHEDLSAKGNSQRRSLGNYVSADVETIHIYAPEETNARSSKLAENVTVDNLQQKRQQDLENARSSGTVNGGNNNAYKPYQPPRQPPNMQQQQQHYQQQPTMGYPQQQQHQQQQPAFRKQPPPIGGGQYAY